ncbi:MAG: branched-chain amino acid ABC transporter permease [Oscillospiraceae bacterium]|nr:branched-chain amino acid ABC transporter permease [Oscillospiraceae bacterium]
MNFQLFVSGLSLGAVYAFIAVGFAIVFSIMKFSNFAHGSMISACAYIGYFFQAAFAKQPPFVLTVLFTVAMGMLMAVIVDFLGYRRLRKKKSPNLYYFLSSITFAIMIEQILNIYFGKQYYSYPFIFKDTTFYIGSIRFSTMDTMILATAVGLLTLLILLIEKTKIGLAIRAVAINPETSRLMGINSSVVITTVFVLAGILAGVAGVFLGMKYTVYPSLGPSMMIKGFVASVIGGLGSLSGAIIAALLLGIIEMLITYFFGALWTPVFLFGIMLLFLFIKPEGISGKFAKDKV